MTQLMMWEYEGKTEWGELAGEQIGDYLLLSLGTERSRSQVTDLRPAKVVPMDAKICEDHTFVISSSNEASDCKYCGISIETFSEPLTPPVTKTYLTTEQFTKVWESLDEPKQKELSAARNAAWGRERSAARSAAWFAARGRERSAAWSAAGDANLAVRAQDKITDEQFNLLTSPWTSCGLSLFAEDWDEVLNPKVLEPTGFGAIVKAKCTCEFSRKAEVFALVRSQDSIETGVPRWYGRDGTPHRWSDLINPAVISEGQK